jgi:hypothetical protein
LLWWFRDHLHDLQHVLDPPRDLHLSDIAWTQRSLCSLKILSFCLSWPRIGLLLEVLLICSDYKLSDCGYQCEYGAFVVLANSSAKVAKVANVLLIESQCWDWLSLGGVVAQLHRWIFRRFSPVFATIDSIVFCDQNCVDDSSEDSRWMKHCLLTCLWLWSQGHLDGFLLYCDRLLLFLLGIPYYAVTQKSVAWRGVDIHTFCWLFPHILWKCGLGFITH